MIDKLAASCRPSTGQSAVMLILWAGWQAGRQNATPKDIIAGRAPFRWRDLMTIDHGRGHCYCTYCTGSDTGVTRGALYMCLGFNSNWH